MLPSSKQHYGHIAALFSDVTNVKFARRVMERTVGFDNLLDFTMGLGQTKWNVMMEKLLL